MIKTLFQAVQTKLEQDIPQLKTVKWYREQDNVKGAVLACPAVYIEFEAMDITTLSNKAVKAVVNFNVYLIIEFYKNNTEFDSIAALEMMDKISWSLQGFNMADNFSSIAITRFTSYHERNNYTKFEASFQCEVFDQKEKTYVTVDKVKVLGNRISED